MSQDITIHLKNGAKKEFKHVGRAGGSWGLSIRYEGGFAIIQDEWQNETGFPSADIERVETKQHGRF